MKYSRIIALALAAAVLSPASARSYKRGVSENQFSLGAQMEVLTPGVSWYYNWANTPGKGWQSEVINFEGYDFVPMVWNNRYNADAIREYVRSHPNVKYLLGFNEPNFTAQSNMTPAVAAQYWPEVVALARELGLKLVAPAMNYSPNAPYQQPTKWFDEFVALVGKDAFDFVAIHNYGGLGVMKTLATEFHERYGKDVWVTEFCYWPNEGNASSRVEPVMQVASMVETVEWLEKTPWIYRYAWFKPIGRHENTPSTGSPCYGLVITENGTGPRTLSPQGYVYVYMSEFNPDIWHAVAEEVPATEYISQTLCQLWPGNNPQAPLPIEVSQFSAGATLDYQFDVPADGAYNLVLTVSGQGEPVRFDPCVGVSLVEGENATVLVAPAAFTLPGSDTEYVERTFSLNLKAGHQTLRLVDGNPYRPSGIHISSLRLVQADGIEDVVLTPEDDTDAPTYTIDGRIVKAGSLAPGIYIRAGRKFIVR